ncbi:MAG TPA: glycine--tRNA ligase [Candidatus Dormibacteraeota bacterium]|nr:glycine--tRNA ligase [Candidatus Dormibacteraeota bacterium]
MIVERENVMEKVTALCKRRGFVYPSSEIYGGLNAIYDYGPYGVALRRNIRNLWWRHLVELRDDVVGLESAIIMHPRVWLASGHLENFVDPLVECRGECRQRFRADHLEDPSRCPTCGGPLSEPRRFNMMFKTHVGPVEDTASEVYLRPETAQGMFVDFKSVLNSMRVRVPFGVAQQGRSFRNEISPGNFIFRLREFEQMEMEYFVRPGDDERWHRYWIEERMGWYVKVLGIRREHLRLREHGPEEKAHYAKASTDVEYRFPFGWGELEGIANRTDYDLRRHQEFSKEDLTYLDPETGERYLPYVIEPAAGVDRIMVTLLVEAYDEEEVRGETRVLLRFHRNVAPVQVAVVPLSKKEELIHVARKVQALLRPYFRVEYDQTGGHIGRRYRRQDEIGTPFCVTIDFETLADHAVTIRERDSMAQERVPIAGLVERLQERFEEEAGAGM